jgi:IS605 OrfB family transposase
MRVSPEPDSYRELLDLMKRYRGALNYSITVVIEKKALSLGRAHKLLYSTLKERFNLPSKVAQDCYREALAIAKSWLRNPSRGRMPTVKALRVWLTHGQSYRIKGEYVELLGGLKLRVVGWDKRYDSYHNREARLVFRGGKFILYISKRVPKPARYSPRGVLAVDINEKHVVGNSNFEYRFETAIERALWYRLLAERLQEKYSSTRYSAWLRRRGIRERIKYFHRKARNIVEDWVKKTSHKIVVLAKQSQLAIAREDLTGLIKSLKKLPRDHRVRLLILSYRKLELWVDWQGEKHGVPVITVEPRGTSTTCPRCGSKMKENGYRVLKCARCSFEAGRDTIAVLNIERKAPIVMGGALAPSTAPQVTYVNPNRWGEPVNPLKGTLALQGGEEVSYRCELK